MGTLPGETQAGTKTMTEQEIVDAIKGQAKLANMDSATMEAPIKAAVRLAVPFVWKLAPWSFRRKEDTLTLTASQEYADLPADFGGFYSIRYRNGSTDGWKLRYKSEGMYEYNNPNPTIHTENEPVFVKIVQDGQTKKWRAYFTPIPDSNYNTTLIYLTKTGKIESYPSDFANLIQVAAWLFIYPPGSQSWMMAERAVEIQFKRAQESDDPFKEPVESLQIGRRFNVSEGGGYEGDVDTWPAISDGSDY